MDTRLAIVGVQDATANVSRHLAHHEEVVDRCEELLDDYGTDRSDPMVAAFAELLETARNQDRCVGQLNAALGVLVGAITGEA